MGRVTMQCSGDDNKKIIIIKSNDCSALVKKKIIGNNIIVLNALIPRYNNIIYTVFRIVKTDLKTSPIVVPHNTLYAGFVYTIQYWCIIIIFFFCCLGGLKMQMNPSRRPSVCGQIYITVCS